MGKRLPVKTKWEACKCQAFAKHLHGVRLRGAYRLFASRCTGRWAHYLGNTKGGGPIETETETEIFRVSNRLRWSQRGFATGLPKYSPGVHLLLRNG